MNDRQQAAQARQLKARDITARPQSRAAGDQAGAPRGWTPAVRSQMTVERAAGSNPTTARFEGLASVTATWYRMYDMFGEYEEQVAQGAFEETLAQEDLHVPLVLGHDPMRRLALRSNPANAMSPLELTETDEGLQTIAPTLQLIDPDTAYIVPKLDLQLIDEMSFRFTIEAGRWSDDFTQYTIQRVNIHRGDVAIVGYGANPHTKGAGLKRHEEQGLSATARGMLQLSRLNDVRS